MQVSDSIIFSQIGFKLEASYINFHSSFFFFHAISHPFSPCSVCSDPSMPKSSGTRRHTNAGSFEAFFEGWLVRQEHYLDELLSARQSGPENRDEDLKDLISRVLAHYQEYYDEKSRVAERNVFLVFSPIWFTSFERAFLWIAGFKPGLAFQLVTNSVDDLSEDQRLRMNRLKEQIKIEEREINHEQAKIQETVAAPPLLETLRRRGLQQPVDGQISEDYMAINTWKSALESVVAKADWLRMSTAAKVVEVLRPAQAVRFLATAAQLQLRIRTRGLQREAERRESSGDTG